jgi:hypothetical protein
MAKRDQAYYIEVVPSGLAGIASPLTMMVTAETWDAMTLTSRRVLLVTLQLRALDTFHCPLADLEWSCSIARSHYL